jgi:RNA polymerase sigma factor (sigma-70 family)
VSTSTAGTLQTTFRRLAQRYEWRLATDEQVFLHEAEAQLADIADPGDEGRHMELAVKRAYSARLVAGIHARDDQAAAEIWRAMWHSARRQGWEHDAAEVIAQETVATIIAKIDRGDLRSPHALLTWQFWILRDVIKRMRSQTIQGDALTSDDDPAIQLSDPSDLASEAEARVVADPLFALIDRVIPEPGRTILLRTFLLDERPREIASVIGKTEQYVRVQKCRALRRLRQSDEVQRLLLELGEADDRSGEGSPSNE